MLSDTPKSLIAAGTRATTRGDDWIVVNVTRHVDCQAVRLCGRGRGSAGAVRTLLMPFDRLIPAMTRSRLTVVSRQRWLRQVSVMLRDAEPFGGLSTAATADIQLLPFQLEPALAMLRHARLRVLIADEVGLGKTVQTGIVLRQLSADIDAFRAVIVTPAGVREQWRQELHRRFALSATVADAAWLTARTRDLPPDVNPWCLPGIHIASLDLVKRPEVLRALEDVSWDIAVVDEVHGTGLGTARLAAADAIARTARRVVLLTATPPDGEPAHFDAITNLGRHGSGEPLTQFRRSRADAGVATTRKSVLLPVRLSRTERRMHRLLDRYTLLVWREAGARDDARARLAAIILRKRALSSAASLALSVRRRLLLLGSSPSPEGQQLFLPLRDDDTVEDGLPDEVVGASGLSDVALERSCLEELVEVAEGAAGRESKLALLERLLSRTAEPMIVFTEYRDTLVRLADRVSRLRPVLLLHGGMTARERAGVPRAFSESGGVLLATDAASEGLNLHERCRLVVHFELPWTPARLEQRTGRVDRLGQTRRVHEIMLVARHTCERLVLAPLLRRARTAAARGGPAARMASLRESTVASAVMGEAIVADEPSAVRPNVTPIDIRAEADAEAMRLETARRLSRARRTVSSDRLLPGVIVTIHSGGLRPAGPPYALTRGDPMIPPPFARGRRTSHTVVVLVEVSVERVDGRPVHRELVPVVIDGVTLPATGRSQEVARVAETFMASHSSRVCARVETDHGERLDTIRARYFDAVRAAARRERDIVAATPSAARRLVQAGLFDAREANARAARQKAASLALLEMDERLSDLSPGLPLRTTTRVVALRFGWEPGS